MKKADCYVLSCPFCEAEVEICIDAKIETLSEEQLERVTMFEAMVCEHSIESSAYYHCQCGYQEEV